jgi:hypothetical protein
MESNSLRIPSIPLLVSRHVVTAQRSGRYKSVTSDRGSVIQLFGEIFAITVPPFPVDKVML